MVVDDEMALPYLVGRAVSTFKYTVIGLWGVFFLTLLKAYLTPFLELTLSRQTKNFSELFCKAQLINMMK